MTKKKVTVWNKLEGENNIIIKEGNAGVYRETAIVKPKCKFVLTLDPNATYRDYVLITLPDNTTLPTFSSDDLVEWKKIVVKEKKNVGVGEEKFYWVRDPVEDDEEDPSTRQGVEQPAPTSGPSTPSTPDPANRLSFVERVKKFFHF